MFAGFKALWKDDSLFLSVVFGLAFALRLGYYAHSFGAPEFPDEWEYRTIAQHLHDDGLYPSDASRPPLYPALLSALSGEPWLHPWRERGLALLAAAQALIGALTCRALGLLGQRLFTSDVGKSGALLFAIHPYAIFFASHALIETLLAFLVVLQVAALAAPNRSAVTRAQAVSVMLGMLALFALIFPREVYSSGAWPAAALAVVVPLLASMTRVAPGESASPSFSPVVAVWLCGFCGGLTAFLHAGHLAFVAVGAMLLVLWPPDILETDRSRSLGRGRWIALYALAFLAPVSLWTLRNYQVLHAFVPVTSKLGTDLYEAFGPEATGRSQKDKIAWPPEERPRMTEIERDVQLRRLAWDCIKADPARALWLGVKKVAYTWNPFPNWEGAAKWYYWAASGVVCLPIIVGALLSPFVLRGVPRRTLAILWAPILYYTALHFVFVGSVRYRMAFEPCLILLAAATWVTVWRRVRR